MRQSKLLYTDLSIGGDLSVLDLETGLHSNVIKGSDILAPHGLAVIGSTVYFSDSKSRQIKSFKYPLDEMEPDIQVYAGNGDAARRYGIATFASFGQPSSIVAEGKSLLVCDTSVNAVSLVSSVKSLYLACKNYGDLFDAFGVHANTKYVKAMDALQVIESCLKFYQKCQSDIIGMFNLSREKKLDGSFGSPASDTINSLAMVHQSLTRAQTKLPHLQITTKALTTQVNEHLFAKAKELGLNEAVGCLDFATNFPSIVEEVMKRITRLPFIFYTHPNSYYEVPQDFVKFEDLPTIPKPQYVPLPSRDIVKMNDYRKKWLEAVRVATVRSETTKHRFSTLYEVEAPGNKDVDFTSLLRGNLAMSDPEKKMVFYKGTVFHKSTEEREVLVVSTEDIYDGSTTVQGDVYVQDRIDSLRFAWECADPALNWNGYSATSIQLHSIDRLVEEGAISLTEDQFEELQRADQDIGNILQLENVAEDSDGCESDNEEIEEQISRSNIPTHTHAQIGT